MKTLHGNQLVSAMFTLVTAVEKIVPQCDSVTVTPRINMDTPATVPAKQGKKTEAGE